MGRKRNTFAGGADEVDDWKSSISEEEDEEHLQMLEERGITRASNELGASTSIYKGKFLCFDLAANVDMLVASEVNVAWVTCYRT